MQLSLKNAIAALEQFEGDLVEAATTPTVDEEISSDNLGDTIDQESGAIDGDVEQLTSRTEKLGDVIDMVEGADTPDDEPLPTVAQQGVDIALESIGLGLESDDAAKESKAGLVQRLKAFFVGLLETMRRFAARLVDFVKRVYTYATDRSARNRMRAEKAKAAMGDKSFNRKTKDVKGRTHTARSGEVYSARLLTAMRRVNGVSLEAAMENVIDFVRAQGALGQRGVLLDAAVVFGESAEDPKNTEKKAEEFLNILHRIGDAGTSSDGSAEQRKAANVGENVKMSVSGPFFGGHRAWIGVPTSLNFISSYNHGVAVLDKINTEDRTGQTVPEVSVLIGLCDKVEKLDAAIVEYRKQGENLAKVEEKLKMFAARLKSKVKEDASGSDVSSTRVRALANAMNTALPRLIKGPQVEAVKYASEAGSMLMSFVQASMSVYEEVEGVSSATFADISKNANRGLPKAS